MSGRSLPELKRAKEKLEADILARQAIDDKKKAERDKKRIKGGNVLVPASPPKDKNPRTQWNRDDPTRPLSTESSLNPRLGRFDPPKKPSPPPTFYQPPAPRPSSFIASISAASSSASASAVPTIERTSSLSAAPVIPPSRKGKERAREDDDEDLSNGQRNSTRRGERSGDLTVIETLEMGPAEFGNGPGGDGKWESIEPNSGLRLSKRTLSHDLLQSHLADRFHVPPSVLYSIIRLSRDGTFYDIPLQGDWITIAVVAEQNGPIRTTKGGPAMGNEASDDEDGPSADGKPSNNKKVASKKRGGPRKFISFKLVSLPSRSSGKSASSGDATLTMLLFEADSCTKGAGGRKIYKGGSGGAYEKFWNIRIGTVIAVLNPKVLRPLKNAQAPHPLSNALAINPESVESITQIGHSQDLGTCIANKLDGNRCTNWVDKRSSEFCEFHIHSAVKKQRASRSEFGSSTSSMNLGVRTKGIQSNPYTRKSTTSSYDPVTKTGLLPRDTVGTLPGSTLRGRSQSSSTSFNPSSATYVFQGQTVRPHIQSSAGKFGFGDEHVSEKMGRGKAEIRKRKREMEESEEFLFKNLKGGGPGPGDGTEGGKNLEAARKALEKKRKAASKIARNVEGDASEEEAEQKVVRKKSAFSAEAIRRIGFNPCVKDGRVEESEETKKERQAAIALIASDLATIPTLLGPVPGPKHRSSVLVPSNITSQSSGPNRMASNQVSSLPGGKATQPDDSDSDLEIEGAPSTKPSGKRTVVLNRFGSRGARSKSIGTVSGGEDQLSDISTGRCMENEDEENIRVGRQRSSRDLGSRRVHDDEDEEN